jgi:hypothetical protein
MSDDPDDVLAGDPHLTAVVRQAAEIYGAIVPPALRREIEAFLCDVLNDHPVGTALLDRARPRPPLEHSGEVAKLAQPVPVLPALPS